MAGRDLDAVFYCKETPEIVLRKGMFHICYGVGDFQVEFVLSPNNFLKALRKANKIADQFHEGMRNIFEMGDRKEADDG